MMSDRQRTLERIVLRSVLDITARAATRQEWQELDRLRRLSGLKLTVDGEAPTSGDDYPPDDDTDTADERGRNDGRADQ